MRISTDRDIALIQGFNQNPRSTQKPAPTGGWSGNVLFSHGATPAVSSGLKGLTAVFGMGTGVSLSL
jgi:hypothetical protein